jgi:hypothetical protein
MYASAKPFIRAAANVPYRLELAVYRYFTEEALRPAIERYYRLGPVSMHKRGCDQVAGRVKMEWVLKKMHNERD